MSLSTVTNNHFIILLDPSIYPIKRLFSVSIDQSLLYFIHSNKSVQPLSHTMTSLNNCVQEFIKHQSSTLFPSDNPPDSIRRPHINRFNSIPSSSTDIEDEDPSLLFLFHCH
jgi:hypothetical protein